MVGRLWSPLEGFTAHHKASAFDLHHLAHEDLLVHLHRLVYLLQLILHHHHKFWGRSNWPGLALHRIVQAQAASLATCPPGILVGLLPATHARAAAWRSFLTGTDRVAATLDWAIDLFLELFKPLSQGLQNRIGSMINCKIMLVCRFMGWLCMWMCSFVR